MSPPIPRIFLLFIGVFWCLWMTVLPLGHLTGFRNSLSVITIIAVLAATKARNWREIPGLIWMVALVVWACASLLWSNFPATSFGKVRTDLLLPLGAYAAGYLWVRNGFSTRGMTVGALTGLSLLAVLSLQSFVAPSSVDLVLPEAHYESLSRSLPIWYPGVGDASVYGVFALSAMLPWASLRARSQPWLATAIAVLVLCIIAASRNRNALVLIPITIGLFFWLARASRDAPPTPSRMPVVWSATIAITLALALAFALEYQSRERLLQLHESLPAWGHAALFLLAKDPRPQMWSHYLELGMQHLWTGVGFGRTVPGMTYAVHSDQIFVDANTNGFTHAHNILINWWLQLGLVGLFLLVALMARLVLAAYRWGHQHSRARALYAAIATFITVTVARNLSDDFLVYGTATLFWLILGIMFGLARRATMGEPFTPHQIDR